jgi:hypothetical protein
MIFYCKVCGQPITREMAVESRAGAYNGGYCQRHAVATPDAVWPPTNPLIVPAALA